ncbi:MAG: hypothetical protein M9963_06825 [Kiritimatiellae bacterium]|nr:hypothetical protein [Kiritimatiellia bacterium]
MNIKKPFYIKLAGIVLALLSGWDMYRYFTDTGELRVLYTAVVKLVLSALALFLGQKHRDA